LPGVYPENEELFAMTGDVMQIQSDHYNFNGYILHKVKSEEYNKTCYFCEITNKDKTVIKRIDVTQTVDDIREKIQKDYEILFQTQYPHQDPHSVYTANQEECITAETKQKINRIAIGAFGLILAGGVITGSIVGTRALHKEFENYLEKRADHSQFDETLPWAVDTIFIGAGLRLAWEFIKYTKNAIAKKHSLAEFLYEDILKNAPETIEKSVQESLENAIAQLLQDSSPSSKRGSELTLLRTISEDLRSIKDKIYGNDNLASTERNKQQALEKDTSSKDHIALELGISNK
jgi:hypothetical protein